MTKKIITIVGVTGTQGSSVADVFLKEGGWHVQGITRDPSKLSSQAWADKGVELVKADINDFDTLKPAFDGSNMGLPMGGDALVPLVDPRQDTGTYSGPCSEEFEPLTSSFQGKFTKALVQTEPGKTLLGFGSLISWIKFAALWGKTYGATCRYQRIDRKVLETAVPGCIGEGLADMFEYIGEFGYDGCDPSIVYPDNLGVHIPVYTTEEYIKDED
ncbi:hypothetical protein FPSE_07766 [Fusarium pseudograminearum CS3096]|uniref:NmrA-like domain-containing protein n=1 Tax=Fusarium pseudograminearum (strain CS3096) TaxID=1028729 RepID=K3VDY5_FUSPC|nr:hypothetical protein FPSE_07766 [Fusarium pseudograminearum CS3096]EKJ72024.1 hypothetical protein FPSE_07766 [Fusarium pseudograminearum CS3096]